MNHCGGGNFKRLLKRADKVEAKVAVILGEEELKNGTLTIKDLRTTEQEVVPEDQAVTLIKRILERCDAADAAAADTAPAAQ